MQLSANGIALEVEIDGPPTAEPLLLIMGLGMQLIAWPEGFVQTLVAAGFRVIRFDNRDVGLSQRFDHLQTPRLSTQALRFALKLPVRSLYTLADMADDSAGVLEALGTPSAHVCGVSMGGMIAQHLASRQPGRVKSLTLMMTSSGARSLPGPTLKARAAMLSRPSPGSPLEDVVAHYVRFFTVIGSPAYPAGEALLRREAERAFTRAYRPQGTARQLLAIAADGDRSALLPSLRAPTQIIHGRSDPLVPVAAAFDLAAKIHGSQLDVIDGMGHDLPAALWQRFADDIGAAAARA